MVRGIEQKAWVFGGERERSCVGGGGKREKEGGEEKR